MSRAPHDPHHLDEDLAELSGALWRAVGEVAGPEVLALVRGVGTTRSRCARVASTAAAAPSPPGSPARPLGLERTPAYTQWCPPDERRREPAAYPGLRSRGAVRWRGSFAAVAAMAEAGMTADEVRALFARAL